MAEQISVIKNDKLTVKVSNIGATVKSVSSFDGKEYIWSGDERFWRGTCPILFPICGGLVGDTFSYEGKKYKLGRHGYIRFSEFDIVSATQSQITYHSQSNAETMACYPFVHEFFVTFALKDNSLKVTYSVKNNDKKTMYFSVGAHEGYQLEHPTEQYSIVFDAPENPPVYSEVFTPIEEQSVSYNEDGNLVLTLSTEQFKTGSLVFHPVKSKNVALVSKHGDRKISVDISEAEYLVLWSVPNASFLCIEPWNGYSDRDDFVGEISEREGIVALDSNDCYTFNHTITFD